MSLQFAIDVKKGLTDFPKHISSKYFYDEVGDKLFQQIMELPEYYPTRTELSILQNNFDISVFEQLKPGFDLFELGAGDGLKTKALMQRMLNAGLRFTYKPIDISQNALDGLAADLTETMPTLGVTLMQGTYFDVLKDIQESEEDKAILFLGSNIGNLIHSQAIDFLSKVAEIMGANDLFIPGFDLTKDPETILAAYNDSAGVTAAFNKNVLARINRELGGNFNLNMFKHIPLYNPETGTTKSYLMSLEKQLVYINALNLAIDFEKFETIHTEISQKYTHTAIEWLCKQSGLVPITFFTDKKNYFANYVLKRKP